MTVNGPNRVCSKTASVDLSLVTTNLCRTSINHSGPILRDVPQQRRYTLEEILVKVRVAGILNDDTQDADKAIKEYLVLPTKGRSRCNYQPKDT